MWVGGLVGFVLDVSLPGTDEERGILKWREPHHNKDEPLARTASIHTYDIPFVTPFLQKFPFVRYIPFLPYYGEEDDEESLGGMTDFDDNNRVSKNGIQVPNQLPSDDAETTL